MTKEVLTSIPVLVQQGMDADGGPNASGMLLLSTGDMIFGKDRGNIFSLRASAPHRSRKVSCR